jgi:hypothetical protein
VRLNQEFQGRSFELAEPDVVCGTFPELKSAAAKAPLSTCSTPGAIKGSLTVQVQGVRMRSYGPELYFNTVMDVQQASWQETQ